MTQMGTQSASTIQPTPPVQPRAVIITSASELFADYFVERGEADVLVADNAATALFAIRQFSPACVFADFRPLKDGWSGIRVARELRRKRPAGARLWLMAEGLDSQLESIVVDAGAVGLLRRTPRAVARAIKDDATGTIGARLASEALIAHETLAHLVHAFRAAAGPLASMHLAEVLGTNGGTGEALRAGLQGVVKGLSDRLVLPAARESFLALIASRKATHSQTESTHVRS